MKQKLYQAVTHLDNGFDKPRLIHWYCPERLNSLAKCQDLISDFHLCPDEPVILKDFEYMIYCGLLTEEERKKYLNPLNPDHPEYVEGIDLSREEIELWKNHRYTKDELTRAINEFFTKDEITILKNYLNKFLRLTLSADEIAFPMTNFQFKGYCREGWHSDKAPDYILHEDPSFPLNISVEGIIIEVYTVNVNITLEANGKLGFKYIDEP